MLLYDLVMPLVQDDTAENTIQGNWAGSVGFFNAFVNLINLIVSDQQPCSKDR